MLPNFMIIGVQKCGTTSLHHYLSEHPDIFLPEIKETKFFAMDERYEKGLAWYEQDHFSGVQGEKAVGEIDPDYIFHPQALERMANDLDTKEMKFILVLRNPVDRAFSQYLMSFRRGLETLTFMDALKAENERVDQDYFHMQHFSYTTRGLYTQQIERFHKYFPEASLKILFVEDLKADPLKFVQDVFAFLNVDPDFIPAKVQKRFHKATIPKNAWLMQRMQRQDTIEKRILKKLLPSDKMRNRIYWFLKRNNLQDNNDLSLQSSERKWLQEYFAEEVRTLSQLTSRNLDHWLAQGESQA